jgi:hypothetical protein
LLFFAQLVKVTTRFGFLSFLGELSELNDSNNNNKKKTSAIFFSLHYLLGFFIRQTAHSHWQYGPHTTMYSRFLIIRSE